jgi:hypothetical protein
MRRDNGHMNNQNVLNVNNNRVNINSNLNIVNLS